MLEWEWLGITYYVEVVNEGSITNIPWHIGYCPDIDWEDYIFFIFEFLDVP